MINVLSFDPNLCKKSAIGVMEAQPVVLAVRHQHVPNTEKFSHARKRETKDIIFSCKTQGQLQKQGNLSTARPAGSLKHPGPEPVCPNIFTPLVTRSKM